MSEKQLEEFEAYLKGVLRVEVIRERMGNCEKCGKYEDLRGGLCFDCAMPECTMTQCSIIDSTAVRKMDCFDNYRYRDSEGKWHCTRPEGRCY